MPSIAAHSPSFGRRVHVARLIGLGCLSVALLTHSQEGHRVVPGWTLTGVAGLLSILVWLVAAWGAWRAYQLRDSARASGLGPVELLDGALLLWGIGYLVEVIDDPGTAGNIYRLNLFGSTAPATIVLYWSSLATLCFAAAAWLRGRMVGRWANISVSVGTLIVLALVAEGVVRAKALLAPATQGFPTYETALWGRRYARLNHRGFRDGERPLARVPGTKRLLLIGDSFAFGVGIRRTEDRLGEQLVQQLGRATGESWEVINASHPDRQTLDELAILDSNLTYQPDVVVLEYVFNDIDYLYHVTPRIGWFDPQTLLGNWHPVRLLFLNSFLFQEAYVRIRAVRWSAKTPAPYDPYTDTSLMRRHFGDLARFVAMAERTGAVVGIVPVDPRIVASRVALRRYETFVDGARAAGLPVWRADSAFNGLTLSQLTVNYLDGHPNEAANQRVAAQVWPAITGALQQREQIRTVAHTADAHRRSAAINRW